MIHRLRGAAHVIDMHQLTKDPEQTLHRLPPTQSSPERGLDRLQLARYLEYCSEVWQKITILNIAATSGQRARRDSLPRSARGSKGVRRSIP
jgi:hypothetical protein